MSRYAVLRTAKGVKIFFITVITLASAEDISTPCKMSSSSGCGATGVPQEGVGRLRNIDLRKLTPNEVSELARELGADVPKTS